MIEIRTFAGTPQELHEFVMSVWRGSYEGRMVFPDWTADYLDWQLDLGPNATRDFLVAAYEGQTLAGVILGCPVDLQTPAGVRGGVISSWLSVASGHRGQGLVGRLKEEQARRLRHCGGDLVFAYRYVGSRRSLSKPPTPADQASGEWSTRKVGFWVRVLRPLRAARFFVDPLNRAVTLAGAPFTRKPKAPRIDARIRPFEPHDLSDCLTLLKAENSHRPFCISWTPERLLRHCSGPVGNCLVVEQAGRIQGLISFHVLPFYGRTREPVGVIDLIATGSLSGRERRALIGSALQRIAEAGGVLALKLRTGDVAAMTMFACGFFPWVRDSYEALRSIGGSPAVPLQGPQQILWR